MAWMSRAFPPAAAVALLLPPAAQAVPYSFTPIVDPAAPTETFATGINNLGQIVGNYRDGASKAHGFIDTSGSFATFDPVSSLGNFPGGINDNGVAVGSYDSTPLQDRGYTYSAGSFTPIDVPPAVANGSTLANGINNVGQVVGAYFPLFTPFKGFLFSGGVYTDIVVPGSSDTVAYGINNHGVIVGTYDGAFGFTDDGGVFTKISVNGHETHALGINDLGQVVGWYRDAALKVHGFLDDNGTYTTIDYPGATTSTMLDGIDNAGEIVGIYDNSGSFLARPITGSTDIPESGPLAPLATLLAAFGLLRRSN